MVVESIGIPLCYYLNPDFYDLRINRTKMFYGDYLSSYVFLSSIAIIVLLLSLLFFAHDNKERIDTETEQENASATQNEKNYYYIIGLILLIMYAIFTFYGAVTGKLALFDYSLYKTSGSRLGNYLERGYWFATIFVCGAGSKRQILKALPFFAVSSIILVLAGNRNDVYYPFLIGLGMYYMRFKSIPYLFWSILFILVFFASPLIILYRNQQDITLDMFSPISLLGESFFELGGQLTAVSHMFTWLESGSGFAYGMTYLLGIAGSLIYPLHLPILEVITNSEYWIGSKITAIGFAMFAELYYNFGFVGMILSYVAIGYIISDQNYSKSNLDKMILKSYICLWILFLIRNSFAFSFVYFMMFLSLYFFEKLLRMIYNK